MPSQGEGPFRGGGTHRGIKTLAEVICKPVLLLEWTRKNAETSSSRRSRTGLIDRPFATVRFTVVDPSFFHGVSDSTYLTTFENKSSPDSTSVNASHQDRATRPKQDSLGVTAHQCLAYATALRKADDHQVGIAVVRNAKEVGGGSRND